MIETPERIFAEALAESPLYGPTVQGFVDAAWSGSRGYNSRCKALGDKLRDWMRGRNPIPDDGAPLELLFFSIAIDSFPWTLLAEHVAEKLGMPGPKYAPAKPRLR